MSDHKLLVLITRKPLVNSSPSFQRLLLRLQKYEVNVSYVPGKYMYVADTLSRAFLNEQLTNVDLNDDMGVMVHSLITNLLTIQEKLAQMKSGTVQDEDLQMLCKIVHIKSLGLSGHSLQSSLCCLFCMRRDFQI